MSRDRKRTPLLIETVKDGKKIKTIGCPYCKPSHELLPNGAVSPCGTYLLIQAVQNIYFEKNITCIVCGKGDGTFTKAGENYKHLHDCTPGKKIFNKAPTLSLRAALAWRLPAQIQKLTGIIPVQVTDDKGKILGYTFDKP
jgi:hypothetical protein